MPRRQSRVALQRPVAGQPVGVLYQDRIRRPRIRELVDLASGVAGGAVVRDEMAGIVAVGEHDGADVAEATEPQTAAVRVDLRHRHRGAARAAQPRVDRRHQLRGPGGRAAAEDPDRLAPGVGRHRPVAEPIHDQDRDAALAPHHQPAVAAHVFAEARRAGAAHADPLAAVVPDRGRPHLGQDGGALTEDGVDVADVRLPGHGAQAGAGAAGGGVAVTERFGHVRDAAPPIEREHLEPCDRRRRDRLEENLAAGAVLDEVGGGLRHHDRDTPRRGFAEAGAPGQLGGTAPCRRDATGIGHADARLAVTAIGRWIHAFPPRAARRSRTRSTTAGRLRGRARGHRRWCSRPS